MLIVQNYNPNKFYQPKSYQKNSSVSFKSYERDLAIQRLIEQKRAEEAKKIENEKDFLSYYIEASECKELPEQTKLVEKMLLQKTRDITNGTDENCEKITKAILNKNGTISKEGLNFLHSLLNMERSTDLLDLVDAIETVKGDNGIVDTNKSKVFINHLSLWGWWKSKPIRSVIETMTKPTNVKDFKATLREGIIV